MSAKLVASYKEAKVNARSATVKQADKLADEIAKMFNQHTHGKLWIYGNSK